MTLPLSILLIALGAILTWAVDAHVNGLNIHVVGVVLMVVGLIGLLLTLMMWDRLGWGHYAGGVAADGDVVVRRRGYRPAYPARRRRTTVVEDDAAPGPPRY
jgi:hypothetical protein